MATRVPTDDLSDSVPAHGLLIYRASRLEALLQPLQLLLQAAPPAHPLAPQTLIASHPGIQRWLSGALAQQVGAGGIVANLDIVLPSTWIDRQAQAHLGHRAVALAQYRPAQLRWHVFALLQAAESTGVDAALLARFLASGATSEQARLRRQFQLAERFAALYSQYLVYRPDWLQAWQAGKWTWVGARHPETRQAQVERGLLAPLWQALHARLGTSRADVVAELVTALQNPASAASSAPLHVFGISHLAPAEWAVLRAAARTRTLALYLPDPCREYWGGLARTLPVLRHHHADEQRRLQQPDAAAWLEQGHPLLARWGRLGQQFLMLLADDDDPVQVDLRHGDDAALPAQRNRLQALQYGIRRLEPALVDTAVDADAARADASLRVHACHTRLRELEVLRDAVLAALSPGADGEPALAPAQIVVMAPDIAAYAPLIPAVFGRSGDPAQWPPYHLADIATGSTHPLFLALRRWLAVPGSRLQAQDVLDLLALPDVARVHRLAPTDLAAVERRWRDSRVAWGLDAADRTRFDVPAWPEQTFAWAMDRLLAGHVMGTDDATTSVATLADGTRLAPLPGIEGPAAAAIGALDALLVCLQRWQALADAVLPAAVWVQTLETLLDASLRPEPEEAAARDAWAALLAAIRRIGSEPAAAGQAPLLSYPLVRDLLLAQLDAVPERQAFLMGGITFCGMVPRRAIPFGMIAVLGLDEDRFPRSTPDAGLDPMTLERRIGDRDVRSDDRYLFLETLMSARRRLHLSWVGQSVRDGSPCNPAAPLAELLAELDRVHGIDPEADDADARRHWLVRHPLQPFDRRYFDGSDPRLFSHRGEWARMHGDGQSPVPPLWPPQAATATPAATGAVALAEVQAYYRDPARHVLATHGGMALEPLVDARMAGEEPLSPGFDPRDRIAQRVFFEQALPAAAGAWPPPEPPSWLSLQGLLPHGVAGRQAWQALLDTLDKARAQAAAIAGLSPHGARIAVSVALDAAAGGAAEGALRVHGQIAQVHTAADGARWLLRLPGSGMLKPADAIGFRDRVPAFLDWALLRLADDPQAPRPVRLHVFAEPPKATAKRGGGFAWCEALNAWDAAWMAADDGVRAARSAELRDRVRQLVQWAWQAPAAPHWYFPKAAWAARDGDAAAAWIGRERHPGERDYAPGYARWLVGDLSFDAETPQAQALRQFAIALEAVITLPAAGEAAP